MLPVSARRSGLTWPAVMKTRSGRPLASVMACSLVFSPPFVRPIGRPRWSSPPRQVGSLNHAGEAASSRSMGPSLFGGFGSSIFELYPSRWRLMSIAGSRFSSGSAQRPSHHGIRRVGRSNLTRVLTADLLSTLDPLRTRLTRRPAKDIFPPAVDLFSFQVSIKSRLHPRATSGTRCRRSTFCA